MRAASGLRAEVPHPALFTAIPCRGEKVSKPLRLGIEQPEVSIAMRIGRHVLVAQRPAVAHAYTHENAGIGSGALLLSQTRKPGDSSTCHSAFDGRRSAGLFRIGRLTKRVHRRVVGTEVVEPESLDQPIGQTAFRDGMLRKVL